MLASAMPTPSPSPSPAHDDDAIATAAAHNSAVLAAAYGYAYGYGGLLDLMVQQLGSLPRTIMESKACGPNSAPASPLANGTAASPNQAGQPGGPDLRSDDAASCVQGQLIAALGGRRPAQHIVDALEWYRFTNRHAALVCSIGRSTEGSRSGGLQGAAHKGRASGGKRQRDSSLVQAVAERVQELMLQAA